MLRKTGIIKRFLAALLVLMLVLQAAVTSRVLTSDVKAAVDNPYAPYGLVKEALRVVTTAPQYSQNYRNANGYYDCTSFISRVMKDVYYDGNNKLSNGNPIIPYRSLGGGAVDPKSTHNWYGWLSTLMSKPEYGVGSIFTFGPEENASGGHPVYYRLTVWHPYKVQDSLYMISESVSDETRAADKAGAWSVPGSLVFQYATEDDSAHASIALGKLAGLDTYEEVSEYIYKKYGILFNAADLTNSEDMVPMLSGYGYTATDVAVSQNDSWRINARSAKSGVGVDNNTLGGGPIAFVMEPVGTVVSFSSAINSWNGEINAPGATYAVYEFEDSAETVAESGSVSDYTDLMSGYLGTFTTAEDPVSFVFPSAGTYYLAQIGAPDNAIRNTEAVTVNVTSGEIANFYVNGGYEDYCAGGTMKLVNEEAGALLSVSVSILHKDGTNFRTNVSGITLSVVDSEETANAILESGYDGERDGAHVIWRFETADESSTNRLPLGTYYIVEENAPAGTGGQPAPIEFTLDKDSELTVMDTLTYINAGVSVVNEDAFRDVRLSGATFTVMEYSKTTDDWQDVATLIDDDNDGVYNIVSEYTPRDESFGYTVSGTLYGTEDNNGLFRIYESTAPENYRETGSVFEFDVNGGVNTFTEKNTALITVRVIKKDDAGEPLDNVQFTLTYGDEPHEGATDGNGEVAFSGILEGTSAVITETVPQYYKADSDYQNKGFAVTRDGDAFTETFNVINRRLGRIKVQLTAKDTEGALSGAVYKLYDANGNEALLASGEPVGTLTTNAAGEVVTGELFAGTYFLRQESAPLGYKKNGSEIRVDVAGGRGEPEKALALTGEPYTASFSLLNGASPIAGASFTLTKVNLVSEDSYVEDNTVTYTWTTDGTPHVISAIVPGTYKLTQNSVAGPGYWKAEDEIITVTENNRENVFTTENKRTSVRIFLLDDETNAVLSPYEVEVKSEDGVVYAGVAGDTVINTLSPGTYMLSVKGEIEDHFPVTATAITVEKTEELRTVNLYASRLTSVTVKIVDEETGEEIEGLSYQLVSEGGSYSGFGSVQKKGIVPGAYTLRVNTVPAGYAIPDDAEITVVKTSTAQAFLLPLSRILGSILVSDMGAGRGSSDYNVPVKGVKVLVRYSEDAFVNGNEVKAGDVAFEAETGDDGTALLTGIPAATYGTDSEYISYYITEGDAPEQYDVSGVRTDDFKLNEENNFQKNFSFGIDRPYLELSVRLSGPDGAVSVKAGDAVTCEITVKNTGKADAKGVTLKAVLPDGLTLKETAEETEREEEGEEGAAEGGRKTAKGSEKETFSLDIGEIKAGESAETSFTAYVRDVPASVLSVRASAGLPFTNEEESEDAAEGTVSNVNASYEASFVRLSEAPVKQGDGRYGFAKDDTVFFEARVKNTGNAPIAFREDLSTSIPEGLNVTVQEVSGAGLVDSEPNGAFHDIVVLPGEEAVVRFSVDMSPEFREFLSEHPTDDAGNEDDGYRVAFKVAPYAITVIDAAGNAETIPAEGRLESANLTSNIPVQGDIVLGDNDSAYPALIVLSLSLSVFLSSFILFLTRKRRVYF